MEIQEKHSSVKKQKNISGDDYRFTLDSSSLWGSIQEMYYLEFSFMVDRYIENFYHTIFFARDRLRHNYAAVNIKQSNSEFYDNLIGALRNHVLVEFVNEKDSKVIIFDFGRRLQDTPHEIIYSE